MAPQPNGAFVWVQAAAGPALVCRPLEQLAPHIFTTRPWPLGSPNTKADEGWAEVATTLGVDPMSVARLHQVHGSAVFVASGANASARPPADVIVTGAPEVALAVQTADCVPLLIADRRSGVVAAGHAGWRGLAARVPQVAVAALTREFGSQPSDLVVAVGPSIGACCYEVGADVREAFMTAAFEDVDLTQWFFDRPQPTRENPSMPTLSTTRRADHWFMDGWSIARHQLELSGVSPDHIHVAALCTASHPETFCSYRRDGAPAGRMAGAIRRGTNQ